MFESILAALKQSLPYYEREDNDDYLYIAKSVDLARAAKIIRDMVSPAPQATNSAMVPCPAWSDEPLSACKLGFGGMCNDRCFISRSQHQ